MEPLFTVITPCYNAEKYIAETIESVLSQKALLQGRARLQYIIVDGASKDGTLDVIRNYADRGITVVSEKDQGMYDALVKGFRLAEGEIVSYINAGDLYQPTAFDLALDVIGAGKADWIVGLSSYYNEKSQIIRVKYPFGYKRFFVERGFYGSFLPAIQQESTFWRKELLAQVDFDKLKSFRLAGDSYLWSCFARVATLEVVEACYSGFKIHAGQLSGDIQTLRREMLSIRPYNALARLLAMLELALWIMPRALQRVVMRHQTFQFDFASDSWSRPQPFADVAALFRRLFK